MNPNPETIEQTNERTRGILKVHDAWLETLKHFGIERPVLPFEMMTISRLVTQYHDWKTMVYAVTGMRI